MALAMAQAGSGDYQAAAKSLKKTDDLEPGNVTNQYRLALLQLQGDDVARPSAPTCAKMSKQCAATTSVPADFWFLWTCGLGPAVLEDYKVALGKLVI